MQRNVIYYCRMSEATLKLLHLCISCGYFFICACCIRTCHCIHTCWVIMHFSDSWNSPADDTICLLSAFSSFGLIGKTHTTSSVWYLNSSASNHMTSSSAYLTDNHKYTGDLQIHTMDGERLPIVSIGDILHSIPFRHVFYFPHLSINLLSLGQLVKKIARSHFLVWLSCARSGIGKNG